MYKLNVAVCSQIRIKRWTQSEHHVEFLNVKTWRYVQKPLGFKRLMRGVRPALLYAAALLYMALYRIE
jgi:hypothetical protein